MNEPQDPNLTVDNSSAPSDSLEAGLAAAFGVPSDGPQSVLAPLTTRLGKLRPVLLRDAEGDSNHVVRPKSDAMPTAAERGDRYQLAGEIARGGMGAVLRGRDVDLGRDLAVKVLLERHAHRPEVVRRFLEEAQIGGQLQHPGVVPVYDIGRFGERPFFTMKLVKGQTLAALLAARPDASADRPRLLGIALQVAQTVAYAHAKGVIHRDLKPANVMVGAFGEVQVMDWGLAKVLAEGGVADEERATRQHQEREDVTTIRIARSGSGDDDTEAGSLLGTPAYMPPEQANGDVVHLDRRADVFGLGAVLCEILTGKAPYVGRSSDEVRRKAANGDLAEAYSRIDGCGADPELIALVLKCLAAEAADRPADAKAVADGLIGYLDGVQARLRQAELSEAEARARAEEESKRRRVTLALAATILLAVTAAGGGWLWLKTEHEARRAHLSLEVNDALNKAMALREQAKAATAGAAALFARAREQIQRAAALVQSGESDVALRGQVERLQEEVDEEEKDRTLLTALDEARLAEADGQGRTYAFGYGRAVPFYRRALAAYGVRIGEGEPSAAAERISRRPEVRQEVAAVFDEWIGLSVDPSNGVREPHLEWLKAVAAAMPLESADDWTRRFRAARSEPEQTKRLSALERLADSADVKKSPTRLLTHLAEQLWFSKDDAAAVRLLRRTWAEHPADFWVNEYLGRSLTRSRPNEKESEEGVRFLTAAVALRPESSGAYDNLGAALLSNGRLVEARACFAKAIELDPKDAGAYSNLGVAQTSSGQSDEAIASFRKAVELDPSLGLAHSNLGNLLKEKGRLDDAIISYRKSVEVESNVSDLYNNLGIALRDNNELVEAVACLQKAVALDPKYASAYDNLGTALLKLARTDEAIDSFRRAVDLDPKLVGARVNLGVALAHKNELNEAVRCFEKAVAVDTKCAPAHDNLGAALLKLARIDEAIVSLRKAVDLDPKLVGARIKLGLALQVKGQVDDALDCFRESIRLDPNLSEPHFCLAELLAAKGRLKEAIPCYRKGVELKPQFALGYLRLGDALASTGEVDEAIFFLREAVRLDRKNADAYRLLGRGMLATGHIGEAVANTRRAVDLDPRNAENQFCLGALLGDVGEMEEAVACLEKAIQIDPTQLRAWSVLAGCRKLIAVRDKYTAYKNGSYRPSTAEQRIVLVDWCRRRKLHHAAAGLLAEAFAVDPKSADDLKAGHRYDAACYAALAAAGQGTDADGLDSAARTRLRKQALDWLRADLGAWTKQIENGKAADRAEVAKRVGHWLDDPDLISVRDEAPLMKLSAEERAAFTTLWTDVAALLKKCEPTKGDMP